MGFIEVFRQAYSQIAVALITIFVGVIIAKLAGRVTKRVLAEAELNKILVRAGFKPMSDAVGALVEYCIYIATVLVLLQQFGLTEIVLGIIAIIALAVIAFSLTLTVRDFIPNAIVGLYIRKRMQSKLGKQVQIGAVKGRLEHFGVVASTIKNEDENYVPHLYSSKFV